MNSIPINLFIIFYIFFIVISSFDFDKIVISTRSLARTDERNCKNFHFWFEPKQTNLLRTLQ